MYVCTKSAVLEINEFPRPFVILSGSSRWMNGSNNVAISFFIILLQIFDLSHPKSIAQSGTIVLVR